MGRMLTALAACLLLACLAAGDVVYMKDGSKVRGKATRKGDVVVVESRKSGGTVVKEYPAADVLYISKSKLRKDEDPKVDANSTSPDPNGITSDEDANSVRPMRRSIGLADARRPETVVFALMRSMEVTRVGTRSLEVRRQIRAWQSAVKDRKRKVDTDWIGPEDFVRRRDAYIEKLAEAEDLFKRASKIYGSDREDKIKRRRLEASAQVKLEKAAPLFPDPAIRYFLVGVAELRSENFRQARFAFTRAIEYAPRVAGLHQGLAIACLGDEKPIDALEAAMACLKLEPYEPEALELANQALQAVPGRYLENETFVAARDFLKGYKERFRVRGSTSSKRSWLMPGRDLTERDDSLPTPEYTRLAFRQAVGVPIGECSLLVDQAAVKDHLDLYVKLSDGLLVPAKVLKVSTFSRGKADAPPLAIVQVDGVKFTTPVARMKRSSYSDDEQEEGDPAFAKGQSVVAYGLGLFPDMGTKIFPIAGEVTQAEGSLAVDTNLAAGEAAGPVINHDGKLVGFLKGKIDPLVDGGGKDELWPVERLEYLIRRGSRGYYGGKYAGEPREIEGTHFAVYATFGETFED